MRKLRNSILIVLILSSLLTLGQTNKFEVGLEVGPSLTSLRGNDVLDKNNDLSFGFSSGLTFQYNFPKLISIRTNISFERKSSTSQVSATDQNGDQIGEITYHSYFDYLTIPILGRLTFGKKINFFVNAGPYIGYLIKLTDIIEAYGEHPKREFDDTDYYKRTDLGITTGLGARFPIKNKLFLSIEIRNNFGLTNISSFTVVNDGAIKTNSTNLLFGIEYRFGTRIND